MAKPKARRSAILPAAVIVLSACTQLVAEDAMTTRHGGSLDAPTGQNGAWSLVFRDEFNAKELDVSKWVTCHWWNDDGCTIPTNNELQWYRPENVSQREGNLVLTARESEYHNRDDTHFDYTSGMVSTGQDAYASTVPHRFADTYFYAEIRARIPKGRGLWPALWLLPAANTHPPEIDIMEVIGQDPRKLHMTVHFLDEAGELRNIQNTWANDTPLDQWHVYAVDWQPDRITWYFDGQPRATLTAPAMAIPHEPMYFVANLAVGGNWPGSPDGSTEFPAEFEIDFVRIWKRAP